MSIPATDSKRRTVTAPIGTISVFRSVALTTTPVAIKTSPGTITNIHVGNVGTSAVKAFLQLYDATTGNVIVGTTTPTYTFEITASGTFTADFSAGLPFSTAITAAITSGAANGTAVSPTVEITQIEYS